MKKLTKFFTTIMTTLFLVATQNQTPKYYWKGMKNDRRKYIKKCVNCNKNKIKKNLKEPMIITETPTKALDIVQIDTIGPLPRVWIL